MRSTELGVRAAATALRAGEVSAAALVDACLDRIGSVDPTVKAWIHVDDTGARAAARAADAAVRPGATLGPLHGVPITVKEAIDVAGMRTTWGNPEFRDHVADADGARSAGVRRGLAARERQSPGGVHGYAVGAD